MIASRAGLLGPKASESQADETAKDTLLPATLTTVC